MEQMKKRVESYHQQNSHAEVYKKDDITPKGEQMNLFKEKLLTSEAKQHFHLIGQLFDTYWLIEYEEQLYIIDQHAAHEKVLYEKKMKDLQNQVIDSQYLSPPLILNLNLQESEIVQNYQELFQKNGFEIEPFGSDSYAVRAVPSGLSDIATSELLTEILNDLTDDVKSALKPEIILDKIASRSCKAAVKGNSRLSSKEAEHLISQLLELDNPYHCPHGRPTIIRISKKELEKKFKRIV
jgi:DNA mismatch repair protein MutL